MSSIDIIRDTWGIGHATATSREDAFFAQGHLAAEDRFWQMEFDRLKADGRWAATAGPAGVREDRFFRRIALAAWARSDWEALSDTAKSMTVAYSAGVNHWLEANRDHLPREFEAHSSAPAPWEPWHCVAVYKVRHIFMGTTYRKLWRGAVTLAAGPDLAREMRGDPVAATAMFEPRGPAIDLLEDVHGVLARNAADLDVFASRTDVEGGSNSWVVDGTMTASGKPLLAGDPHRGIEFPNVYHQCHLTCDEFDVVGLAFPGVPGFPHFGHNDRVAWCITHGMADDTDLFIEPGSALTDRRTETIEVFGSESVEVDIAMTPSGPVAFGEADDGHVLAFQWTGTWGADTTFECLEPMLLATDCAGLEESVRRWVIPVNNLLTADVGGDISFRLRGRVVERPPANRWTPVAGSPESRWDRLTEVPYDDLQQWRNPARGFLVTANNRTSDHGPYISLDFAGPARHDRIVTLLSGRSDLDVDDMAEIHRDVQSLVAPGVCAALSVAVPESEPGRGLLECLLAWNHALDLDAAGPVVYWALRAAWADEVGRRLGVVGVELGEAGWPREVDASRMLLDAATGMLVSGGWKLLDGLGSDDDLARVLGGLFDQAAQRLAAEMGGDRAAWRWGEVHTMVSPHPLGTVRPDFADLHPPVDGCAGDGDTVRCGSVAPVLGPRAMAGSVARYVFDVSNWDASGWVVPHGVSGVRGSGHDLDQRDSWLAGELLPMAYSRSAVDRVAAARSTIRSDISQ